jgi:hypothetical protein
MLVEVLETLSSDNFLHGLYTGHNYELNTNGDYFKAASLSRASAHVIARKVKLIRNNLLILTKLKQVYFFYWLPISY